MLTHSRIMRLSACSGASYWLYDTSGKSRRRRFPKCLRSSQQHSATHAPIQGPAQMSMSSAAAGITENVAIIIHRNTGLVAGILTPKTTYTVEELHATWLPNLGDVAHTYALKATNTPPASRVRPTLVKYRFGPRPLYCPAETMLTPSSAKR